MGKDARSNPFGRWKQTAAPTTREAYDQYGRQLGVGDLVTLQAYGGVVWQVTATKPIMDPKAPPGLVAVTMVASTLLGEQGGVPLQGVIKVRDASEALTPEQLQAREEAGGRGSDDAAPGGSVPSDPPPAPDEAPADGPKLVIP